MTKDRSAVGWVIERARASGPLAPGSFRAVVIESDATSRVRDFPDRAAATRHANEAARETDDSSPLAFVLDASFVVVHRGEADRPAEAARSRELACPFCGQTDVLYVDAGGGEHQTYVEDCAVCCRPRIVHVEASDDPQEPRVWLERGA